MAIPIGNPANPTPHPVLNRPCSNSSLNQKLIGLHLPHSATNRISLHESSLTSRGEAVIDSHTSALFDTICLQFFSTARRIYPTLPCFVKQNQTKPKLPKFLSFSFETRVGFAPTHKSFADSRLKLLVYRVTASNYTSPDAQIRALFG